MGDANPVTGEIELLPNSNQTSQVHYENNFLLENDIKKEVENDSDFEARLTIDEKMKIEIEEVDMKKECFDDDIHEDISECNDQSLGTVVGEESSCSFDVDIENIKGKMLSEEITSTSAFEKLPVGNSDISTDSTSLEKQQVVKITSNYKCKLCEKTFTNESNLKLHDCLCNKTNEKRLNMKKKRYSCDVCKKSFTKLSNLNTHTRLHTGKPYSCNVCQKSFTQLSHLIRHTRIHTGENPYSCDVCNKTFTQLSHLTEHKRIHTGEKPYSCDVCKISFTQLSHIIEHKRIHTGEKPHLCDVCNISFTHSTSLKTHRRLHTGEKPYSCDVCQKSFTHSTSLKTHKRLHTGEKPYSCDVCIKSFTHLVSLKKHKRLHTG